MTPVLLNLQNITFWSGILDVAHHRPPDGQSRIGPEPCGHTKGTCLTGLFTPR